MKTVIELQSIMNTRARRYNYLPAVRIALREDGAHADLTARAMVPPRQRMSAVIKAKADGIVCGLGPAEAAFRLLDRRVSFDAKKRDGERVAAGDVIAEARGTARAILAGERTALNFLQRLSGIATAAARASEAAGASMKILDTRKTQPGMRMLEKYAAHCGGCATHRLGLDDGILIKENHIAAAGSIARAVAAAKARRPAGVKVEVETKNLAEVSEAIDSGADIIMFDNMSDDEIRKGVALVGGRALTEASGNMTLERVRALSSSGVNYISMGAITHSAPALDISLLATAD